MDIKQRIAIAACLVLTGSAQAALIDRGGGFIYDSSQNITWTQNANLNGAKTLAVQTAWADGLSLYDPVRNVTWDDWELPGSTSTYAYLYFTYGITAASPGPFTGIVADWYWTKSDGPNTAGIFNFDFGLAANSDGDTPYFAWAVRPGDVGLAPNAVDDGPVPVIDGVAKIISVGTNDTGFSQPVTVTVTVPPTKGTIGAISPPGLVSNTYITYTANVGSVGADGFEYQMTDTRPASDTATVTIDISPDSDSDGVPNSIDNCTLVANASQCDSDGDGFGNACDGDLNNNNATNAQDYVLFRQQLGQPSIDPTYNEADINCNSAVNAQDYVLFRSLLGSPPGPSAP